MTVVPEAVLQCRRCSGRLRFGFPQNSFIVTKNRLQAMHLMVKEQKNELGETVFDCWGKPPKGEEFSGYDRFKHNQLDYPDYTKIKICDAYVKLDDEKGELQWRPHRAKTLADYDVTVQDGKKVKVPKYVCVPVNPETLEDVEGAADVTLPAYRLRLTVWRPFSEEAPDCEIPFPEERQSKKRKVVSRKSKSKRKKKRKQPSNHIGDGQQTAAVTAAAAAAYNAILNKSVVDTSKSKRKKKKKQPSNSIDDGQKTAVSAAAAAATASTPFFNAIVNKSAVNISKSKRKNKKKQRSNSIGDVQKTAASSAAAAGTAGAAFSNAIVNKSDVNTSKSKRKKKKKQRSNSIGDVQKTAASSTAVAGTAGATFSNTIVNKSAVDTAKNKQLESRSRLKMASTPLYQIDSKNFEDQLDSKNSEEFCKNAEEFCTMAEGFLYGESGRHILQRLQPIIKSAQEHHAHPPRVSGQHLSVYKCARKRGHDRVEIYVPMIIRDVGEVAGKASPKNIRIPVQGDCHADNEEFLRFVTNYVTTETDNMTLSQKQSYVLEGYQVQKLKSGRVKVVGHDMVDDIIQSWHMTRNLEEEVNCEADMVTH